MKISPAAGINRLWLTLGRRLKASFYLYLAAVFTLFVFADAFVLNITAKMKQSSFDLMIRHRLLVAKPDPDIVIVDINEATLAAMAKEYGRWPWPRQVMGEFLEGIEKQKPKAVVFDILFSDPDVYNPDSDAYFNDAVANTDNTFFPILRLDPKDDGLSKVLPERIPGTVPVPGQATHDKTVAVVLPFFDAAIKGGRLGLHNIYPDSDGTARNYTVYRDDYGWLIPSLPARVVEWMGGKPPVRADMLLNWRGGPFTYRYVSFSDVFFDMTSKEKKRPQDEFTGKIVIVGATAAGLFDIKPTPMDRLYPGVEVLATATDNLKRGDYLREPDTLLVNLALALLIIWATAWAFYKNAGQEALDRLFGASQFLLVGISYASINLFTSYINLTGPVMIGVAYFSGARIYASAVRKILEKSAVTSAVSLEGELYAALMLIRLRDAAGPASEKDVASFCRAMRRRVKSASGVEAMKGVQKGIWGLLEGVVVVSWTCQVDDKKTRESIMEGAKKVESAAAALWQKGARGPETVSLTFHEGTLEGGERAKAGWGALFGEALTKAQGGR